MVPDSPGRYSFFSSFPTLQLHVEWTFLMTRVPSPMFLNSNSPVFFVLGPMLPKSWMGLSTWIIGTVLGIIFSGLASAMEICSFWGCWQEEHRVRDAIVTAIRAIIWANLIFYSFNKVFKGNSLVYSADKKYADKKPLV